MRHMGRRNFRWICLLIGLTVLLNAGLVSLPGPVQADSMEGDSAGAGVYEQLKAGKRLLQDKEYAAPEQPTVYLTFDDGPSRLTDRVLDILRDEDVKATFFALGEEAEKWPDAVKRIVKEGHSLGNHTYNHVYNELYSGFDAFWEQIQKSETLFYKQTGVRPKLIRAPGGTYGNFDPFYFYYLDRAGYTLFDWNIDSGDARRAGVKASEIVGTVEKGPFREEMIVLMHDGTGHEETVKALPEIIRLFKDKGYAFAPLTDKVKPALMAPGKSKWPRTYTKESFEKATAAAVAHASVYEPQPQAPNAVPIPVLEPEPAKAAAAPAHKVPLTLQLGGLRWQMDEGGYLFKDGRFLVPLRQLIERMGGMVVWEDKSRTAVAGYGLYRLRYDTARHELLMMKPGFRFKKFSMAQMELHDGYLFVPLRTTVEMLGSEVTGYMLGSEEREVDVALRHQLSFFHSSMKSV
ncbi:polysaccharide deacetylase [Paenibacillus hamazuiensis]|uniref:polysaccharide deacetylase n=1 Tax=Paenibacillus hamazuiensis TaxID=2936508 RepID=UPI00200FFEAA|nr:polysaccharide deacetylase [Paenibacillus hamazuiensis]